MVFKAVSEKIDFDAVKESTTLTGEALAKKQARDKELEAIIKGEMTTVHFGDWSMFI